MTVIDKTKKPCRCRYAISQLSLSPKTSCGVKANHPNPQQVLVYSLLSLQAVHSKLLAKMLTFASNQVC